MGVPLKPKASKSLDTGPWFSLETHGFEIPHFKKPYIKIDNLRDHRLELFFFSINHPMISNDWGTVPNIDPYTYFDDMQEYNN